MNFTPRRQIQAACAAVALTAALAISHVGFARPTEPDAPRLAAPAGPAPSQSLADTTQIKINPRHVTCMAKVVHHEAGNQPREGKIAVAQVLLNRVRQGFGSNVCDVANQPGQFFRLSRYNPNRKSAGWAEAVAIARTVMTGDVRDVTKGALYFHANWARPNSFFRGRTKVARLEDHDFYR
ncbi:MAG: cell wall hydrolase [Sphingomonadales bacterium]